MTTNSVLIDDRLLVAYLTGVNILGRSKAGISTTTYWYYRACRAAVVGASGQLSVPFAQLNDRDQARAIETLLQLPAHVGLPEPRTLVPAIVEISRAHPRLNVMNVEAAASARVTDARVLLSPPAAQGVLPAVLDAEGIRWDVRDPSS